MNNRIMAMLFALVAAMFISIVPVKAEAAVENHNHVVTLIAEKTATCTEDGMRAHYKCNTCDYKEDTDHKQVTSAQLKIDKATVPHTWEWKSNDTSHWKACTAKGCTATSGTANHQKACIDDKNGTSHSWSCKTEGCNWTAENEAHVDKTTDPSDLCVCDYCDAELEHNLADWGKDTNNHWKTCLTCKKNFNVGAHNFGELVSKGDGKTHSETCKDCGKVNEYYCSDSADDKDCLCDKCNGAMPHSKDDLCMEPMYKDPTCTETGLMQHWKCKICGLRVNSANKVVTEAEVTSKALGHDGNQQWVRDAEGHYQWCIRGQKCETKVADATGDVTGVAEHTYGKWNPRSDNKQHDRVCTVCSYTDVAKHVYGEPETGNGVSHKITCVDCGFATRQTCDDSDADKDCLCDVCGGEMPHTDKSKMTYVEAKASTCTEGGHTDYYKCNECGGTYLSDGSSWDPALKPLGHDLTVKGYTATGMHQMQCKRTGCEVYIAKDHYSEDGDCECDVAGCKLPAHSHKLVFVAGKDATCTEAGAEPYYKYEGCGKMFDLYQNPISAAKVIPATGHNFGTEWVPYEGGVHVKFCANCDEFESAKHTFVNGNVQCTVCGGEEELTHVAAKAATCTENGNVEYWTSVVTGKKYADAAGKTLIQDATTKATGHEMSGWEDLGNGQGHKQVCMVAGCKYELTKSHDNANGCFCTECGGFKNGHTNELVEAVPATCSKAGTQAYFKCSCGKLYDLGFNPINKAGSIAQLKHVMNTEVKKDAKLGKHYIECKNCSYKLYENHSMVVSDPNKGNYHQRLCECGELEIETHYDKNGDKKCDVCGHSMNGSSSVKVEQHDNKTVYTGQSETVKPTKDWWWNWQEAFKPSNSGGTTATTQKTTESATTGSTASGNTTTGSTATQAPAAGTNNANTNAGTSSNGTTVNNSGSTVAAPSAAQTNVLVQFVNWFLGLFGF